MSKRNATTDFVPVLGMTYANEYFVGVITEVSERHTAANGKELIRFQIEIQAITDTAQAMALSLEPGQRVWRQATPTHAANGRWNVMRNAGQ
jgi:hypothetical protein